MKRYLHAVLDRAQQLAARSRTLVRLAILIRNQCRCVIKYHLAESPDVDETGEVWLRKLLAPHARYIVDVGANVGDWLAQVVEEKAREPFSVLAYEPSAGAFEQLRGRFGADERIELVASAAGDAGGEIDFFEEAGAGKGSSIVQQFGPANRVKRRVPVVTLDEEIAARGWERIDLLKIDAEGYDMRVLLGAKNLLAQQRIGLLQFEYNRSWQIAGDTLFAALRLLEACGYATYVLKRDGLYTLNYALYEEYFEYSNFAAVSPDYAALTAAHFKGVI